MNLNEAFTALDKLEEDVFSVNDDGIEKLQNFMKNDDTIDEIAIYDMDFNEDEKLETDVNPCHVGDVILDCCVCHSKVFKPVEEIKVDEETQVANKGEECPYCYSVDGFKVVGEVTPFKEKEECDCEIDDDVMEVKNTGEFDEEDIEVTESKKIPSKKRGIKESKKKTITIKESTKDNPKLISKKGTIANALNSHMHELQGIEDVNELKNKVFEIVDNSEAAGTKDAKDFKYRVMSQKTKERALSTIAAYITAMSSRDKKESLGSDIEKYQKWVDYDMKRYGNVSDKTKEELKKAGLQLIKDQYGDYEVSTGSYKEESKKCELEEDLDEIEIKANDMKIKIEPQEEVEKSEQEVDEKEEVEFNGEKTVVPVSEETKEEIELDIDDVDKDSVQVATEECLKESYKDVKFFRVGSVKNRDNKIIVEGIVGFNSGKKRNMKFVYESNKCSGSKLGFKGRALQLKESFSLVGKVQRGRLVCKSIKRK